MSEAVLYTQPINIIPTPQRNLLPNDITEWRGEYVFRILDIWNSHHRCHDDKAHVVGYDKYA